MRIETHVYGSDGGEMPRDPRQRPCTATPVPRRRPFKSRVFPTCFLPGARRISVFVKTSAVTRGKPLHAFSDDL